MDVYIAESRKFLDAVRKEVNSACEKIDSFELIILVFLVTWIVCYLWNWFTAPRIKGLKQQLKEWFFHHLRRIPYVRKRMEIELETFVNQLEAKMLLGMKGLYHVVELPENGLNQEEILNELDRYQSIDEMKWQRGRVSGAVYKKQDPVLEDLVMKVYGKMSYTNPLHPDLFPGLRKMEAEIIRMVCTLFKGSAESCGSVTTGGTESIFLACKAYRDYAMVFRGVLHPEIVTPVSAHAAFDKAAQILNIKLKHVPINPKTMEVDMGALKKAINKNTCMLVGSAPQFPHGAVDPIEEIAKLGDRYKIPVHVDCCLGGFLVPFMRDAGFDFPACDFSVKGVTSISVDTHKYGFAPKGTSVVIYNENKYHHCQFSVQTDWPGGVYATPTLGGSRAGGTIATCWSSLMYFGKNGYIESTRNIVNTTRWINDRLKEIEGIFVFGQPKVSVIAIGSHDFDIYRLSQLMADSGWNLNVLQFPSGFHFCITQMHTQDGIKEKFIADIKQNTAEIMKEPNVPAHGAAAIYGMAQSIPDRSIVSETAWAVLDTCYSTKDDQG